MNKRILKLVGVFGALGEIVGVTLGGAWAAPNALEIMTQNEDRRKIESVVSEATLTTGGGGSQERKKEFTWWKKLTADQVHFNTLTRFKTPAEIKGEGILFLEHEKNNNEILLYLPNFKKIRRVESQQQSSSFMGSELSYSDIASPHLEDYQFKFLKEETCPSEEFKGQCQVIESLPVNDDVKERTGYSKSVNWVRSDNQMTVKSEHYNLEGELIKRMNASQIKQVDSQKNKWMAYKIRVEQLKTGKFTLLEFADVKINQPISAATFTPQNLSRN